MLLAREGVLSPTWADSLRGSRGRQKGRQAAGLQAQQSFTFLESGRGASDWVTPSAALFPGSVTVSYGGGLIVMEKAGFPPGMEEHEWQGMAAGFALSIVSAVKAVPVMMSQLSAAGSSVLMTAFHQKSSCHFCLSPSVSALQYMWLLLHKKTLPAQLREKGSRLFAVLGR